MVWRIIKNYTHPVGIFGNECFFSNFSKFSFFFLIIWPDLTVIIIPWTKSMWRSYTTFNIKCIFILLKFFDSRVSSWLFFLTIENNANANYFCAFHQNLHAMFTLRKNALSNTVEFLINIEKQFFSIIAAIRWNNFSWA